MPTHHFSDIMEGRFRLEIITQETQQLMSGAQENLTMPSFKFLWLNRLKNKNGARILIRYWKLHLSWESFLLACQVWGKWTGQGDFSCWKGLVEISERGLCPHKPAQSSESLWWATERRSKLSWPLGVRKLPNLCAVREERAGQISQELGSGQKRFPHVGGGMD
jgi:hypothetical protein